MTALSEKRLEIYEKEEKIKFESAKNLTELLHYGIEEWNINFTISEKKDQLLYIILYVSDYTRS